jgi:hypothetical protein
MQKVILAITLCLTVNTATAAYGQAKPTAKKEQAQQAQPTKSLINASSKTECETQGGTWRDGACYTN